MSNKSQGYTINWQTNTITMTKKFAAEANHYGSEAYNMLMDVRGKGFNIAVRETEPRKACPTRITFKKMEHYLSCLEYADERLEQLHAVMNSSKSYNNPYEYVRKWFIDNYPQFCEKPVLTVNCSIAAPRVAFLTEGSDPLKLGA